MIRHLASIPLVAACLLTACAAPQATTSGDPLVLGSEDGVFELHVEGLLQTTYSVFDSKRAPSSDGALKRLRPEFDGRVGWMRFKLEPKFTEHDVELEEAWLGADLAEGRTRVMVGRMKAPFNLEEVRSRRHIDFVRFSILNQFAPVEDHGVFVNGKSESGLWEWGLAAYKGNGSSDTTSSKDVAARLMAHPFSGRPDSTWRNLQVGLAGTYGRQDEGVGGDTIDNAAGLAAVHFAPGARLDGNRRRLGLEAAWFDGPWFLQGEWIAMRQEMSRGAAGGAVTFSGAYLTAARVLTGESKTFAGVTPDRPFDPRTGEGCGAWVAALRVSELSLDDDIREMGLAVPSEFTDRIRSVSLGLNWIPNSHAILRNSLVYSRYDNHLRLDRGADDHELALLCELQFHF